MEGRRLVRVSNLQVRSSSRLLLRGVDLEVNAGQVHLLVGESGCGKTMLIRALLGILPVGTERCGGAVELFGKPAPEDPEGLRSLRARRMALIPQDPAGWLNPRVKAGVQMLEVPLQEGADLLQLRERAYGLARRCGLSEEVFFAYPARLSGGQAQRVLVLSALLRGAQLLLCDEPVTALDAPSARAVMGLLKTLADEGAGLLFVTHQLSLCRGFAQQMTVLYNGLVMETGRAEDLLTRPLHPYTVDLIAAVPVLTPCPPRRLRELPPRREEQGDAGCPYAPRCRRAQHRCRLERPPLEVREGRQVRCFYV